MNIIVIGTGYVGLITGLGFSSLNHQVTCVDINNEVVEKLNKGIPTFFEKGLEDLLNKEISSGRFKATTNFKKDIQEVDLIFIAVGTPSLNNGKIDLSFVKKVSETIGKEIKNIDRYISIIIKSTVLPTTTDTLVRELIEKFSEKQLGEFGLGMNPEFLREGSALEDFMNPDRIVIGFEDVKTKKLLENLYKSWNCEKIFVNTRTAELIKYTNNTFLALLISATNEIARISSSIGNIDIKEVMHGVHLDKRWNPKVNNKRVYPKIIDYLEAGCGFGGSCFPKDVKALINYGEEKGNNVNILKNIIEINNDQPKTIIRDLSKVTSFEEKNILILGLAFKPFTDDVRESPAITVVKELLKKDTKIFLHDPIAINNFKKEIGDNENMKFINNWLYQVSKSEIITTFIRLFFLKNY